MKYFAIVLLLIMGATYGSNETLEWEWNGTHWIASEWEVKITSTTAVKSDNSTPFTWSHIEEYSYTRQGKGKIDTSLCMSVCLQAFPPKRFMDILDLLSCYFNI